MYGLRANITSKAVEPPCHPPGRSPLESACVAVPALIDHMDAEALYRLEATSSSLRATTRRPCVWRKKVGSELGLSVFDLPRVQMNYRSLYQQLTLGRPLHNCSPMGPITYPRHKADVYRRALMYGREQMHKTLRQMQQVRGDIVETKLDACLSEVEKCFMQNDPVLLGVVRLAAILCAFSAAQSLWFAFVGGGEIRAKPAEEIILIFDFAWLTLFLYAYWTTTSVFAARRELLRRNLLNLNIEVMCRVKLSQQFAQHARRIALLERPMRQRGDLFRS